MSPLVSLVFLSPLFFLVFPIDNAPAGIRDLQEDAAAECLSIQAEVADIREYTWQGSFDVVVIDRTLHMLATDEQITVLKNLLQATKQGSHVLIADEPSNIPAFKTVLGESEWKWTTTLERRGFLFVQRE